MKGRHLGLGFLVIVLIISGCSQEEGESYEIINDSVVINDSYLYMSVTPHTVHHSDWVELEFESKVFSGDIDFVFGFDTSDGIYPTMAKRFVDTPQMISNDTLYYTCTESFNYTLNPNHFWCYYDEVNDTSLIFDHYFDGGNLQEQTAWWQEEVYSNWVSWKPENSIDYEFMGMDRWYYTTGQPIVAETIYKVKYYIEVPFGTEYSKYTLAIKPSEETIEEAIENEHFWALDPWADYNLDTDIILYYTFDDGENCTDRTGNGHDCTVVGDLDVENRTTGILGQAWNITSTSGAGLNVTNLTHLNQSFSISLWHNGWRNNPTESIVSFNMDAGPPKDTAYSYFVIQGQKVGNGGEYELYIADNVPDTSDIESDNLKHTDHLNEWNYIYVDYDNSTRLGHIYVGNSTDIQNWTFGNLGQKDFYSNLFIGARELDWNTPGGAVDELGFWNRTLTDTEVKALWNNGAGLVYGLGTAAISNMTITPATAYFNSTINCSAIIGFGDQFNATLNWTNASNLIENNAYVNQANGSVLNDLLNLNGLGFVGTETISCYMQVFNESLTYNETTNLTLSNYPPTIPTTITPSFDDITGYDYSFVSCSGSTDPEGDSINYSFFNTSNTILQNSAATTFNFSNLQEGNNSWYCHANNAAGNSSNIPTRNVTYVNLSVCHGSNSYYLNFSFRDENNNSVLNASQDISLEDWYVQGSSNEFNYTYTNNSLDVSRGICVYPDTYTVLTPITITYDRPTYTARTFVNTFNLTNTTTQHVLYLLPTADGIYTTFQVVDITNSPIEGVTVTGERIISGSYVTLFGGTTDASGSVTFWVNPNAQHRFTFSRTGYITATSTITPTQAIYTQTLLATNQTNESNYNTGIKFTISPDDLVLAPQTFYNFGFNINSTVWNLTSYGFNLINSSGNILVDTSAGNSSGSYVNQTLNTTTHSRIIMNYYWIIDSNQQNGSYAWEVRNTSQGAASLKQFFDDLENFDQAGMDNFSKALIFLFFMAIIIGTLVYFGGDSLYIEYSIMGAIVMLMWLGEKVNLLPTLGEKYLLTIIVGLAFLAYVIQDNIR